MIPLLLIIIVFVLDYIYSYYNRCLPMKMMIKETRLGHLSMCSSKESQYESVAITAEKQDCLE